MTQATARREMRLTPYRRGGPPTNTEARQSRHQRQSKITRMPTAAFFNSLLGQGNAQRLRQSHQLHRLAR